MTLAIAIALLALGLGFVIAEILFPSLGLLAVLATASIIGSVATAFTIDSATGVTFLVAVAITVPGAVMLGFKVFPKTPMGKAMINPGLSFGSTPSYDERDLSLVGKQGVVESMLRPAGIARIDGRRVDVVTRGEMIDVGVVVRVLEVQGNRVVVAQSDAAGASASSDRSQVH